MRADSRALAWLSFGVATLVLASPLKVWWARPAFGWLLPFGLWAAVIGLDAWLSRKSERNDD